ncbi:MAG: sialidase family protein [Actinomycetota bacterium]
MPVPHSVQQVYHPGSPDDPTSTAIPDCIAPDDPVGCYSGEKLVLQGTRVGGKGMEPTIGVAPDGTAYYGSGSLVVDTSTAWGGALTNTLRSTDGGLTWTSVQQKVPVVGQGIPPANADPMIYVDPATGRVFNLDLTGACNWLNYSDDKGATWISNPLACGDVPVDHQSIVAAKPRAPLVAGPLYQNFLYYCTNRVVTTACARSIDGGITWQASGEPALRAQNGTCYGLSGFVSSDPEGRIFVPGGNNCPNPWVSVSEDNGVTWTAYKVSTLSLGTGSTHTDIASDSAGNLYYVWFDSNELPWLAISRDHGKTWGTPIMVAPPGVLRGNFPVVAAGDAGKIAISFPSATSNAANRPWNETVTISTNALDSNPTFVSATGNDPADPVHRGACQGRCAGMWDFIDLVIAKTGEVWTSASDDCIGSCNTGVVSAAHAGDGIAIRQIGGPLLRG